MTSKWSEMSRKRHTLTWRLEVKKIEKQRSHKTIETFDSSKALIVFFVCERVVGFRDFAQVVNDLMLSLLSLSSCYFS